MKKYLISIALIALVVALLYYYFSSLQNKILNEEGVSVILEHTRIPSQTPTYTPTPTSTPTLTSTPTSTSTSTPTLTPTSTSTFTPTPPPTLTSIPTSTPTFTSTDTPIPTSTFTPTPPPTPTSIPTFTPTDTPESIPEPSPSDLTLTIVPTPSGEVTEELPSDETPTAPVTSAEIEAHVDLKIFDYIIVRDLDRNTPTPYAEVAQISDIQTTFTALARDSDGLWIYVRLSDGTTGWIGSEFLVPNQPLDGLPLREPLAPPEIGAGINLSGNQFINVRAGPDLNSQVVTQIDNPNTRFMALGQSQDTLWILVRLENRTLGWILRKFVVSDKPLDELPKRIL